MPTRARSLGRSVFGSLIEMPSTTMSPFWIGSSAFTVLISVDLPEPDGPQTTTTSPFLMAVRAVGQHLEAAVPLGDVLDVDHGGSLPVQRMMAIFFCSWRTSIDSEKQMMK